MPSIELGEAKPGCVRAARPLGSTRMPLIGDRLIMTCGYIFTGVLISCFGSRSSPFRNCLVLGQISQSLKIEYGHALLLYSDDSVVTQ